MLRKSAAAQAPGASAASAPSTSEQVIVTGARIRRRDYTANTPLVTVGAGLLDPPRDWNLCTLDDPQHDLAHCRSFADPGARGARGRAAAQFADGMTYGWANDLDAAIAAFDRALAQAPLAIAYLNRGLAHQRQGDADRAHSDFDAAVRHAPDDPRTYYYRSRFFDAQGDTRRAQADANRAIDIDPNYARLLR
jgi:tetratricopeptide (TPR) repeat protein